MFSEIVLFHVPCVKAPPVISVISEKSHQSVSNRFSLRSLSFALGLFDTHGLMIVILLVLMDSNICLIAYWGTLYLANGAIERKNMIKKKFLQK